MPFDEFVPTASKTAQIAFGTAVGVRQVLGMQDGSGHSLITGHSLGGCLASVLAPCVANWVGSTSGISVYTIAAPSTGNEDFASYYNALFTAQSGHSTAFRFFNSLDVVPNAWASVDTVETYYPPLISCPSDINKIISRAENAVDGKYRQLGKLAAGSAIELADTVIMPVRAHRGRMGLNPFENALFLWEAAQQHACTTYQALLQTPQTRRRARYDRRRRCRREQCRARPTAHAARRAQGGPGNLRDLQTMERPGQARGLQSRETRRPARQPAQPQRRRSGPACGRGDTIAGKVDLIAGEIDVAGQPTPTLWGSALFVAPEYRGSGAGVMLIRKMQGMHPTMSICGVSQAIHPIYQKLGWNDLEMPRHVLLRRSRAVVEKYLGENALAKLAAPAADALAAQRAALAVARQLATKGLRVHQVAALRSYSISH